jgi:hypothetical protein
LSTQKSFNVWNYKPWWCQPWSIILTGIMIIAASWAIAKTIWLTVPIAFLILGWWTYFLIILPELIRRSQIERE